MRGNKIFNNSSGIYIEGSGTPIIAQNQFGGNGNIIDLAHPNIFPQQIGTNVIIATNGVNGIQIYAGNMTTSGTWDSTTLPYVLRSGEINVNASATLTINSRTVVKLFGPGALRGAGVLNAVGTPAQPIVFTSLRDDTVGGDTNVFEGNVSPASQNWASLRMDNSASILQNAIVRYGGSASNAQLEAGGNAPTIRSVLIERSEFGLAIQNNSNPLVEGCTFQFHVNYGIRGHDLNMGAATIRNNLFQNMGASALTINGSVAEVRGNKILNNSSGIYIEGSGTPIIAQNQFGGNNSAIIQLANPNVFPQQLSSNIIVSSNAINGIEVFNGPSGMTTSGTWDSTTLPYVLRNAQVTINSGTTLTITPGTVLKLRSNGALRGSGVLNAVGTPTQPIVFTSLRDDTVGGDTNTFEGNISPANLDWGSLRMDNSASVLQNAIVRYGGSGSNAQLEAGDNAPTIRSVLIERSDFGLAIQYNSNPLVEGCTFQFHVNYGIRGHDLNMGAATIRNNLFQNMGASALTINGSVAEVRGNKILNNSSGIYIGGSGTPIIAQNQFGGNNSAIIQLANPNVFPQQLSSNIIVSSNAINGIEVFNGPSGMTTSGIWDSTTLPYVLRNDAVYSNQTLTLAPGVIIKTFGNNSALIANHLIAQGTFQQPVIFTSLRDDSFGGDTNTFEGSVSPAPGDWAYIRADGGNTVISNSIFKYGGLFLRGSGTAQVNQSEFTLSSGNGIFTEESAKPIISSCTFSNMNTGIRVTAQSTPTITNSSFLNGLTYGVASQNTLLTQAPNNWWGHPTGPLDDSDDRPTGGYYNPTGQGARVSNYVNYTPWVGGTPLTNPAVVIVEGQTVSGPLINLQLSVSGPATQMRVAETPSFPGNWEAFASSRTWTLSNGDGLKTVYAQFRATDGSVSDIASDTVLLQTAPPSAAVALSSTSPVGLGTVQVTLQTSETLISTPTLTLTPFGQTASTIPLTTQNYLVFSGSFAVSTNIATGQATFAFTGVDLSSTVGTQITSGATFFIDTTPPSPPQLNTITPLQAGAIRLTWSDPSNESSPRFVVARATTVVTETTLNTIVANNISTTTFTDTPTQDGLYFYAVKTRDVANNISTFSNVLSAVSDRMPPLPVTTIQAVGLSTTQVQLTWAAPGGEPPAHYRLYRAVNSTPTVQASNLIYQSTGFAFVDTLSQTGRYYYGVTTRDSLGNESIIAATAIFDLDITSPTVSTLQLTPPAPVKLGPLVVVGQFSEPMNTNLPVQAVLLASGAVNGVNVSSTAYTATSWSGLITITTNVPEGLARLVFSGGRDLANNPLAVSTFTFLIDYSAPPAPANVGAQIVGNGKDVNVTWAQSQPNVTYSLFRSTNNQVTWQNVGLNISATNATDAPPAFSTSVFYAVTARDAALNESTLSISTSVASPFAPFILSPSNNSQVSSSSVTVSGQAQRGNTVIIYSSTGTLLGQGTTSSSSQFSVSITLIQEGNNDIYAVAVDAAQNSSPQSALRRIILNSLPQQVGTPQGTAADTFATVQWPSSTEADIIGYWVYRDGSNTPLNSIRIGLSSTPQFRDIGLTNGRSYSYRVSAEDTSNQIGPLSNPVNVTPQAGPGWTLNP